MGYHENQGHAQWRYVYVLDTGFRAGNNSCASAVVFVYICVGRCRCMGWTHFIRSRKYWKKTYTCMDQIETFNKYWHSVQSILTNPTSFPRLLYSPHLISWGNAPGKMLLTNHQSGGRVVEYVWVRRRTWNPEVAGLIPALATMLELFLGRP